VHYLVKQKLWIKWHMHLNQSSDYLMLTSAYTQILLYDILLLPCIVLSNKNLDQMSHTPQSISNCLMITSVFTQTLLYDLLPLYTILSNKNLDQSHRHLNQSFDGLYDNIRIHTCSTLRPPFPSMHCPVKQKLGSNDTDTSINRSVS
jgi:hypothetical protein